MNYYQQISFSISYDGVSIQILLDKKDLQLK